MPPPPTFRPLTSATWPDLERLFGPERGGNGGCWCQYWRMTSKAFDRGSREARKAALKAQVAAGEPLGLLAYRGEEAVGWCAVAPRDRLPKLLRSRVAGPLGDLGPAQVWMINCFYIARGRRRQGLMAALIRAARDYALSQGAVAVEACPLATDRRLQFGEGYIGLASAFQGLGFEEVARRGPTRPLLRYCPRTAEKS